MKLTTSTEWLFFHLWKNNPETKTSCPGVFVAETLIYRWAKPYFWYFTNQDGMIIRKTKERINLDDFYYSSMQNLSPQGIVATYLTSSTTQHQQNQQQSSTIKSQKQNQKVIHVQEQIEFEYFDKENFQPFFYQQEKNLNAIIQKFIQPSKNHNQIIKVSWSPQFILLYRKANINAMDNESIPIIDRLVTFEGSEHLAMQESIMSPILQQDLKQICQNIRKHIEEVTSNNISIQRMILYFKLDDKNRLWLMFCTSLKVREKLLLFPIKESQSPDRAIIVCDSPKMCLTKKKNLNQYDLQKMIVQNGIVEVKQISTLKKICSNCENSVFQLYDLKLEQIIRSFEKGLKEQSGTVLPENIKKRIKENADKKKDNQLFPYLQRQKSIEIDEKTKDEELEELLRYLEDENEQNIYNVDIVPKLILKVWGTLSVDKFKQMKKNKSWLSLSTKVCDECYLRFTDKISESEYQGEIKQRRVNLLESVSIKKLQVQKSNPSKNPDDVQQLQKKITTKKESYSSLDTLLTPLHIPKQKNTNLVKGYSGTSIGSKSLSQHQILTHQQSQQAGNSTPKNSFILNKKQSELIPIIGSQNENQSNIYDLCQVQDKQIIKKDDLDPSGILEQDTLQPASSNQITMPQSARQDIQKLIDLQQPQNTSQQQQQLQFQSNNQKKKIESFYSSPKNPSLESISLVKEGNNNPNVIQTIRQEQSQNPLYQPNREWISSINYPQFFTNFFDNKKKYNKDQKYNPKQVYKLKPPEIQLPPKFQFKCQSTRSMSDASLYSQTTQNATQKFNHEFMLNTVRDMKNTLKDMGDINLDILL